MAKQESELKPTSYILTTEAKALLKLMAEKEGRSMSKELEKIIVAEAKRKGISVPG